jgi:hypothetical protein
LLGGRRVTYAVTMKTTINVTGLSGSLEAIGQRIAQTMRRPTQIIFG